ncbi:hypothetical protein [Clostridium estertheticum]|nr:hypothetical protein [Clostridium estertheticum]MBX4266824.1 hypothetical protein [Clostridium estertheticum]WLC89010.1 hypothetical protein KTC95_01890 [Clostridium estertheticum]
MNETLKNIRNRRSTRAFYRNTKVTSIFYSVHIAYYVRMLKPWIYKNH